MYISIIPDNIPYQKFRKVFDIGKGSKNRGSYIFL